MQMTRRDLIGSILGTYMATRLPWYARLAGGMNRDQPFSFLDASSDELLKCKTIVVLKGDIRIKGPRLKDVYRGRNSIHFLYSRIDVLKKFEAVACQILDPFGKPFALSVLADFSGGPQVLFPGDTLNIDQNISFEIG